MTFGATVAGPRPRAFGLPRLLVGSAPLFACCNNPKQKCAAARHVRNTQQCVPTRGSSRTCGRGGRSLRGGRNCVYSVEVGGNIVRYYVAVTPLVGCSCCYLCDKLTDIQRLVCGLVCDTLHEDVNSI